MLVHATERHGVGYADPRAVYGTTEADRLSPMSAEALRAFQGRQRVERRFEAWSHVVRGWDMTIRPDERLSILPVNLYLGDG